MIVRVNWHTQDFSSPSPVAQAYHIWECGDLRIEIQGFTGSSNAGHSSSGPSKVTLNLDDGKHTISISGGDEAFIMNNEGKTIDVIRTV